MKQVAFPPQESNPVHAGLGGPAACPRRDGSDESDNIVRPAVHVAAGVADQVLLPIAVSLHSVNEMRVEPPVDLRVDDVAFHDVPVRLAKLAGLSGADVGQHAVTRLLVDDDLARVDTRADLLSLQPLLPLLHVPRAGLEPARPGFSDLRSAN